MLDFPSGDEPVESLAATDSYSSRSYLLNSYLQEVSPPLAAGRGKETRPQLVLPQPSPSDVCDVLPGSDRWHGYQEVPESGVSEPLPRRPSERRQVLLQAVRQSSFNSYETRSRTLIQR